MSGKKYNKYHSFSSILSSPSSIVPSLSESEKYTVIVDSIKAYVDLEIDLETFIDLAKKLKLFSGLRDYKADYLNDALIKLENLSVYVPDKSQREEDINNTLVTVLNGLSRRQ